MNLTELTAQNFVAFLADIFARFGAQEYLGEPVTMAQHMLQAATIAEQQGLPEHLIVGALLHDVGHFTSELGTFDMLDTQDRFHEDAGAQCLAPFLPSAIVDLVRYHVQAKRYLCASSPSYFKKLSPASVHSLNLQGGPMNEAELAKFKKQPNLSDILQVRLLDDAGKEKDMCTPQFDYFAPMIQRYVDEHQLALSQSNADQRESRPC